jgi:hypothetical protein
MSGVGWNTISELIWLDNIGSYIEKGRFKFTKREILEGYLKSCKKRVNWGSIDKNKCITHANKLLFACK